ncbi:hypothetical protein [Candidatus Amarobacter glycogenicus]|uniref:hypothetical protein n=1 Tax=Candidatus Amarobacter glycogenicus TaxID=3140699 RepID=UPI0031CCA78E
MPEPAKLSDAEAIHSLVTYWADKGDMLHRPIGEIYEAIRDFKVARLDGEVVGTGSLHIMGAELAEVRSLAVAENAGRFRRSGQGIVADRPVDTAPWPRSRLRADSSKLTPRSRDSGWRT